MIQIEINNGCFRGESNGLDNRSTLFLPETKKEMKFSKKVLRDKMEFLNLKELKMVCKALWLLRDTEWIIAGNYLAMIKEIKKREAGKLYRVFRVCKSKPGKRYLIQSSLTLKQAQKHCQIVAEGQRLGGNDDTWVDSYEEEKKLIK